MQQTFHVLVLIFVKRYLKIGIECQLKVFAEVFFICVTITSVPCFHPRLDHCTINSMHFHEIKTKYDVLINKSGKKRFYISFRSSPHLCVVAFSSPIPVSHCSVAINRLQFPLVFFRSGKGPGRWGLQGRKNNHR